MQQVWAELVTQWQATKTKRHTMEMSDERKNRIRDLALSGGLSGGLLGAAGTVLGGFKKPSELLKSMLIGASAGAGLSAGSGYVGGELLGEPTPDEQGGHTLRGSLGGAVGGTLAGGALGSLAGLPGVAKRLKPSADSANFITKGLSRFLGPGGLGSAKRGALIGALGLGAAGAYQGADEGMQMDFIDAMREKQRQKDKREQMIREMYVL